MKNSTKLFYATMLLLMILSFTAKSQTNVSGGIYANITWTLANSPYIVTDTVVVFPGVILTIEPGVMVKFAQNQLLEIRQGELIAMGTATASITFTSNSGMFAGVVLNGGNMHSQIGYCNFYYANHALQCGNQADTGFTVKHCKIMYNYDGISCGSPNCLIDSCEIKYNTHWSLGGFKNVTNCTITNNFDGIFQCWNVNNCVVNSNTDVGIYENYGPVSNCFVKYNNIGISQGHALTINKCVITNNQIGIEPDDIGWVITNCVIDSNSIGVKLSTHIDNSENESISFCEINYNGIGISDYRNYNSTIYTNNIITKNYIENDSIGIYLNAPDSIYCNRICNNTSYGLQYYGSYSTNCAANNFWCTVDSASIESVIYDGYDNISIVGMVLFMPFDTLQCYLNVGLPEIENYSFAFFPNPAHDYLTIDFGRNTSMAEIKIFNVLGVQEVDYPLSGEKNRIDVSNLANGIYFLEMITGNKINRQKFIKE